MFKTEVKYKNFLGQEVSDTLRFNLSEAELLDLQEAEPIFTPEFLYYISEEQDVSAMIKVMRKLIAHSYGILSEDGKVFRKKPEDIYDFEHSAAYTALLEKLLGSEDSTFVSDFIVNVFPARFADEIRKRINDGPALSVVDNANH